MTACDSSVTCENGLYESPRSATVSSGPKRPDNQLRDPVHERPVQAIRGLRQIGRHAECRGDERERHVVAREAGPAVAEAAGEVLPADARVEPNRRRHDVDVSPRQLVTQLRQQVGEGDLGRHERVDRDLGELRILEAHARDRRVRRHDLPIALLEMRARPLIELTDEQEVRIEKVANDAAQGDELRAVAHAEVDARGLARVPFEHRDQAVARRAGQHRAGQHHRVIPRFLGQGLADRAERKRGVLE